MLATKAASLYRLLGLVNISRVLSDHYYHRVQRLSSGVAGVARFRIDFEIADKAPWYIRIAMHTLIYNGILDIEMPSVSSRARAL
jgi:hypothetical protein